MNFIELAKMLAEADEAECFKVISYALVRLDYLKGRQELKETGYVAN